MGKGFAVVAVLSVAGFVTKDAPATPYTQGQWSELHTWDIMAVHCAVLPDGKVLCVSQENDTAVNCGDPVDQEKRAVIFDPATNSVDCIKEPGLPDVPGVFFKDPTYCLDAQLGLCKAHLFCSGHNHLADGRIAFWGGQGAPQGINWDKAYAGSHDRTVLYDYTVTSESQRWSVADVMPRGIYNSGKRYYPTATALGDGSHLIMAGSEDCVPRPWSAAACGPVYLDADKPIVFTPFHEAGCQFETLIGATQYMNWYPFNFLVSDGTVLSGRQCR